MGLEIVIDRDACMGSGSCAFVAPATFDVDDDMHAVVLPVAVGADPGAADPVDVVRRAAESCPTRAIRVGLDGVAVFPA